MVFLCVQNKYTILSYFVLEPIGFDDTKNFVFGWRVLNTDGTVMND